LPAWQTSTGRIGRGIEHHARRIAVPGMRLNHRNVIDVGADLLLYLPKTKQAPELAALLQERESRQRSAKLAAQDQLCKKFPDEFSDAFVRSH
jgi:hypothetical protein